MRESASVHRSKKWHSALLSVFHVLSVVMLCIPAVVSGQSPEDPQKTKPPAGEVSTQSELDPEGGTGPNSSLWQPAPFYSNALPRHKKYLRATLETLGFLGIAEGYYQGTQEGKKWWTWYEYDNFEESMRARFVTGDAYRLDNNEWEYNASHIIDGTTYYSLARSNDLNMVESFLFTAASSTLWELFGEIYDEFSINDAIMTPFGGFATGEPIYQLGEFFQHSRHSIPNRALGILFGPFSAIHRWWDNTRPEEPANVDKFGFTTDVWHRFRVFAGEGGSYSNKDSEFRAETQLGFDFELITAEKFGKPGEADTNYLEGLFNRVTFNVALDGTKIVNLNFSSKTAFWGHYSQSIVMDKALETLEGHSLFWGLGSAFEYTSHTFASVARDDKQAVCDLVGPTLIADYYHCGLHVRTTAEVYPTFSMVKPSAGEFYDHEHNTSLYYSGVKSVYAAEKYYYALGLAAGGRLEMEYGPFGLDGQVRYHYFNSIEGLDRFQDRTVWDDINLVDQRMDLLLTLYWTLPIPNYKLALSAEKLYRWTDIDSLSWEFDEDRFFASIVFEF